MKEKMYCVYIMTNLHNTTLYTGVTNNIWRMVLQHKSGKGGYFTRKYKLTKIVYFEVTNDVSAAILREKQIKAGSRKKKIDLVDSINPEWVDLFQDI